MFAAYRSDQKKEDSLDDDSISTSQPIIKNEEPSDVAAPATLPDWLQNSSFAPVPPSSPKPEPLELSSDSHFGSDLEIIEEKVAKRKKKSKKDKKRRKNKEKTPAPEFDRRTVFVDLKRMKLLPPEQLFGESRVADLENLAYKEMYARQVAKYKLKRAASCLDGGVFELLFPKKTAEKPLRYFLKRKVEKAARNSVAGTAVKVSQSSKPLKGSPSILPLPVSCTSDAGTFLWNPETGRFDLRSADDVIAEEPRQITYNQRVANEPHDVGLWMEYVRSVDSVPGLHTGDESSEKMGNKSQTAILERKLAILEKALSLNSSSLELWLLKLELGREGLLDYAGLINLWKDIEFKFPQSAGMWRQRIDFDRQSQLGRFSLETLHKTYDRCVEKLHQIVSGQLKTHKAEEGTETFMFRILLEKIDLLRETGFDEKSFAALQAVIEFNFFRPSSLDQQSGLEEKRELFELYWSAFSPRFPEPNAVHWNQFIDSGSTNFVPSIDLNESNYENVEHDILQSGLELRQKWLTLERLRTVYGSVPWRGPDGSPEPADPDRIVMYDDVAPFLYELGDGLKPWLLAKMALALRVSFPSMVDCFLSDLQLEEALTDPIFVRSTDEQTCQNFIVQGQFRDQFFEQSHSLKLDRNWTFFLIATRLWALCAKYKQSDASKQHDWRGFRKEAKLLLESDQCRNSCLPFCIYAECLAQLQAYSEVEKTVAATFSLLGNATLNTVDFIDRLALLRLISIFSQLKWDGASDEKIGQIQSFLEPIVNCNSFNVCVSSLRRITHSSSGLTIAEAASRFVLEMAAEVKNVETPDIAVFWLGTGLGSAGRIALYACARDIDLAERCWERISDVSRSIRESKSLALRRIIDSELGSIGSLYGKLLVRFRPRNLRSKLGGLVAESPTNSSILKIFSDHYTAGFLFAEFRRTLRHLAANDHTGIVTLSLLRAEVEQLLKHQPQPPLKLHGGFEWLFDRLAAVLGANPTFWNSFLNFLIDYSPDRLSKELPRLLSHCAYSKPLILTLIEHESTEEWQKHVDHLALNQLRMRLPVEELELLIETANSEREVVEIE